MVNSGRRRWLRRVGLIIGLVWAVLWTIFLGASALSHGFGPITSEALVASVVLASGVLILWLSIVIAWKRELVGGILLIVAGLLVIIGYPVGAAGRIDPVGIVLVVVIMGLPPVVAGLLFLLSWREERRRLKAFIG
ncbi:hypothetical protein ES707_13148 [subsurface metagenome]